MYVLSVSLQYEIIFCIQDEEQFELIKVIRGLMAKYPHVDSRIFIGKSVRPYFPLSAPADSSVKPARPYRRERERGDLVFSTCHTHCSCSSKCITDSLPPSTPGVKAPSLPLSLPSIPSWLAIQLIVLSSTKRSLFSFSVCIQGPAMCTIHSLPAVILL